MEEEGKRDSIAKVIEVAEAKCTELASVDETLEELLSQLQPLVVDCQSQLKPSNQVKRYSTLLAPFRMCPIGCVCVCV